MFRNTTQHFRTILGSLFIWKLLLRHITTSPTCFSEARQRVDYKLAACNTLRSTARQLVIVNQTYNSNEGVPYGLSALYAIWMSLNYTVNFALVSYSVYSCAIVFMLASGLPHYTFAIELTWGLYSNLGRVLLYFKKHEKESNWFSDKYQSRSIESAASLRSRDLEKTTTATRTPPKKGLNE